jgi:dTMP kinase
VHPGLQPHRTFLFDCTFEVAKRRLGSAGKALDRFEREDRGFFERVRQAYLARAAAEPLRFRVIDASRGVPDVQQMLAREIAKL